MLNRTFAKCLLLLSFSCSVEFIANSAVAQSLEPAVFVTNNVGDSVTSFTLDGKGALNFVGVTPTGEGPQTLALTPDGKHLAVGHGTINEVVEQLRIFRVNPDATLTEVLNELIPNSPLNARWLSDETLAVTETSLSQPNNLITYRFDEKLATLTEVDSQFVGTFSYSIATARNSSLAFVNNTFGTASIVAMSADEMGNLDVIETEVVEPLFLVALAASPDGNFLYGAGGISGSSSEITAHRIEQDGSLTAIAGAQSPGDSPKVIGITADGSVLVAGHGRDATVQSFLRDNKTGALTPSGFSFDVGSQGNLGDLVVMNDMMFVTDESSFDNDVQGLLSFRINADGSFTQLGPIVDTQGSRPEYIAAWPGLIPDVLLGDVNLDGVVNLADIPLFVAILSSGEFQAEADIDGDGDVTLADIPLFVEILAG